MEGIPLFVNVSEIKEEKIDENYLIDDKVNIFETAVTAVKTELPDHIRDNEAKHEGVSTISDAIKAESSSEVQHNMKSENFKAEAMEIGYGNGLLYCEPCHAYYDDYCAKCGMLVYILNRIVVNNADNREQKDLPNNILEIRNLFGEIGVFALKVIPEGVKCGPFTGLTRAECLWKIKGGKFIVDEEKPVYLNWMQYINPAKNTSEQNLLVFQYENNLYYQTTRQINAGEELLVYFGEEYEDSLNKSEEVSIIPTTEHLTQDVFACTFCSLGFSSKFYMEKHKTICLDNSASDFSTEELAQCPVCKIYLDQQEYSEHHETYCRDRNAGMTTRTRKLVSLAIQQDKEMCDRLLDLPRYETTKSSSKSEILRYLDVLKDSDMMSNIVLHELHTEEDLAHKVVSQELDTEGISFETVSHKLTDQEVAINTVPQLYLNSSQSKLQDLNTNKVELVTEKKIQELNKNGTVSMVQTVVDCSIEPPPLHYFVEDNNNSTSSAEITLQPEIVFDKNLVCETVDKHIMNDEIADYNYAGEDEEESRQFSVSDSDEYIPTESEVSDTFSDSSEIADQSSWCNDLLKRTIQGSKNVKRIRKRRMNLKAEDTKENSVRLQSSSDEDTVKVSCSAKRGGKRIRNKRYCCCLCQKNVINFSRHLVSMHSNETTVARILSLPKRSKHRRVEFGKLMRVGNFYHNCEVLQMKKGELILLRRPTPLEQKKYTYIDYGPCPDCLGFMLKKNVAHHMKNNYTAKSNGSLERKPISESNAMLAGMFGPNITSDFTSNILVRMRDDEITKICRDDQLILKFGVMMYEKYSTTQCELIRQSMRQIGRLFKEVNIARPDIKSLSNCLKPAHFDVIVQATKTLCVSNTNLAKRTEFQIPSLALKIGHALKKCVNYERGNALRSGNIKRNSELESFLSLMDMEWSIRISSNALNTLHTRKFNCTQLLPITSDLIKLNNYLETEMKKCKTEIEKIYQPSPSCWYRFAAVTLSKIVVFNKRRSGETSRMRLEHYYMRPLWSEQATEESKSAMTQFERQLAEHFAVVEVPGKRGRRVPILLSPEMKNGIDLLLKTRTFAGISPDNPYIFARSGKSLEHMRGHDCLRKCCEHAQLESPENINGTKLRKYIATVTQIINLTENETDWLARHLGHDVRVHRDFYRLHESAVELTKVSRLLLAVDSGQANKFAGKKLDDIELSDLPQIDFEEEKGSNAGDITGMEIFSEEEKTSDDVEDQGIPNTRRKSSSKLICIKKAWTEEEIGAVLKFFALFIKRGTVPGKEKCEECMQKYQVFGTRKWTDLKYYIKNYITKIKKTKK